MCKDETSFPNENEFHDHSTKCHANTIYGERKSEQWKEYVTISLNRAYVPKTGRTSYASGSNNSSCTASSGHDKADTNNTIHRRPIYAGLVELEDYCRKVNKLIAADPSKQTSKEGQELIALHLILLDEFCDFFLASHLPCASPALAATYNLPARMWHHGIYPLLEILRLRLPDSRDHMFAYLRVAYPMMGLLYETVPTFEDTWMEYSGNLGRYWIATEDDVEERKVWSEVARFWYAKAADKNPTVGRLHYHLAVLSCWCSLQWLSLYLQSLTCIIPFESARGGIMTNFDSLLDGKESTLHESRSLEEVFIKAHGLLFGERSTEEFVSCVQQLLGGLLDKYIGCVTDKFKKQGVFVALSNIAGLLEYGVRKSTLRLYFEEIRDKKKAASANQGTSDTDALSLDASITVREDITQEELETSLRTIAYASSLAFGSLAIGLQRIGDKNVYPMVHVYLVFLYSIINVEKAVKLFEKDIPWEDMASFLNALARSDTSTLKVFDENFPSPDKGIGRPLPEDLVMRGQLWNEFYFPDTWFSDAAVEDEERAFELQPRTERILWLGHRIASYNQGLSFDPSSRLFSSQRKSELRRQ